MEGDVGTRQLNPTDADETPDESLAVSTEDQTEQATEPESPEPAEEADEGVGDGRRPSRLGVGWVVCADAAALQAAKDCVAATQAPDTAAMIAAQSKIIECATGDWGVQAPLYSSVVAEAYQAGSVKVQVSDMRAAVERHNGDGSIDVLVAVRTKVTNSETADVEQGYRLRVQMAPEAGVYKIARLDQVGSS